LFYILLSIIFLKNFVLFKYYNLTMNVEKRKSFLGIGLIFKF